MDITNKKKDIIIKILCVIASFALWLYITNVENPIRDYKLNKVPVQILNESILKEHNLILSPNQNFHVTLDLEGPANEVYKAVQGQFKVTANLAGYALKKGENQVPVQIVSYPSNINIKNNNFLRVNIVLDDYVEKKVAVNNDVTINTKQGFKASVSEINPKVVTVSGPADDVYKVKRVVADGQVKDIKDYLNLSFPLKAVDENGKKVENISINPTNVNISFRLTKGKFVPVHVVTQGNLQNGLTLNAVVPGQNNIEILGDPNVLAKVNVINTKPIDLSKLTKSQDIEIPLQLPNNVTLSSGNGQIKVKIIINEYITKKFSIKLNVNGLGKDLKANLSQDTITVILSGMESDINNFDLKDITASLDLTNSKDGNFDIEPTININNSKIKLVSLEPKNIKVSIVKEETETNANANVNDKDNSSNSIDKQHNKDKENSRSKK